MMELFFTLGVLAFCLAGLGLGLLFSEKVRLKGTCGGASSRGGDAACPACGGKPAECPEKKAT